MKRIVIFCVLVLCFVFMLSTCSTVQKNEVSEVKLVLEMYKKVMLNEMKFHDKNVGNIYIRDIKNVFPFDVDLDIVEFALVDMDGNGIPELVLNLDLKIDGSTCVLRYYENVVYGYEFGFRAMNSLKRNGSFRCSNSAFDSGIGRLQFSGTNEKTIGVAETVYNAQDDVVWHKFTKENANNLEAFYI